MSFSEAAEQFNCKEFSVQMQDYCNIDIINIEACRALRSCRLIRVRKTKGQIRKRSDYESRGLDQGLEIETNLYNEDAPERKLH